MKKAKLFTALAVASVAGMTFAGCSGSNTPEQDTSNDTAVTESTLDTSVTISTEPTNPTNAQGEEFVRYLKDIYNGAKEYINDLPQKIDGIDEGLASATTYLKYAMADFNGDGKLELVTVESNNFPVEAGKKDENYEKGYFTFRRFEINDNGGIVENPKSNGLSNGILFSKIEDNIKCYDNGIIAIDQTSAVNESFGYNHDEYKTFLYFDSDIVKKLNVPLIDEFVNSEWAADIPAYVLMVRDGEKRQICLGGAQDSCTEMTDLTADQYESMEKILTDGKEIDVKFMDFTQENINK